MRYFLQASTLFIRGSFRAVTSGRTGGAARVSTLLIHTVPQNCRGAAAAKALERAVAGAGYPRDYRGLTTPVPVQNLCVLQYDFISAFIMAGISPGAGKPPGTTSIIICSGRAMSDSALRETMKATEESGGKALADCGNAITKIPPVSIIVASEGTETLTDEESLSAILARVRAAVLKGVPEAIRRSRKRTRQKRHSFFIFSRFKGEHWVEWTPENCPYYPCHFAGQRCDFCYCPLYPCGDETLGQWAESANGKKVWNCARCTMIHEPAVVDFLKKHPEAEKDELVRVWKSDKTKKKQAP